jgi:anaerobic C4-dicarboxylate transporter
MISTVAAYNLFQKAVINLVLYTNIHKISFFYRLQRTIKNRMIINPKIKKIAIIIYLLMKNATKITKKTTF